MMLLCACRSDDARDHLGVHVQSGGDEQDNGAIATRRHGHTEHGLRTGVHGQLVEGCISTSQ